MTDISDKLKIVAQNPKRVSVDGVSADEQALGEMIEADAYIEAKAASRRPLSFGGLRIMRGTSPGARG